MLKATTKNLLNGFEENKWSFIQGLEVLKQGISEWFPPEAVVLFVDGERILMEVTPIKIWFGPGHFG